MLLLAPCFLGWASSFASVLLFSSLCGFLLLGRFPSLGIFPCLTLLDFSPPFLLLTFIGSCRSLRPRYLSSSCVPLCGLSSPPVAWWPSVFFWPCSLLFSGSEFTFSCLGFSAPRVRVSRWSSTGFSFVRHCFLSSSRMRLLCQGSLCALFFPPLYHFGDFVFFCLQVIFLSSIPVAGFLPRPSFGLSLVSFLFFSCLVFLFCALPSGPPGVSPVTASSSAGHPSSLSSALAASSSTSFGFSPLFPFSGAVLLLPGFAAVW